MTTTYETLEANIASARRRLGKPLTLADKILLGHLDDPDGQELEPGESDLRLRPDRVVLQDVLGQTAFLQFAQTGRARVAVPTTVHCDHLIQARASAAPDLLQSLSENHEVYEFLRSAAARYGAGFWGPGAGIIHQVVLENYAAPGLLIIGTDSHTPNAGGLGACAVGVGGADAVEVMAGMPWELRWPRRIAVVLSGALGGWTAPKDVILSVAGTLGVSGGTHAIVEYIGPGARTISATGKATIANMGAEIGATTSLFPTDERMLRYLAATGRSALVPDIERHRHLFAPDPEVEAAPERFYDQVLAIDLSRLEPHIAGPHSPDRVRPLSAIGEELPIAAALIGSCTNSSYEDMSRAADVARQAIARGLRATVPFFVTPGSERVRATIARDGQLRALEEVGGTVLANACGPCIGQWRRSDAAAQRDNAIVTSFNRNFPGRNDGSTATMNFIASPEVVTALAVHGTLSARALADLTPPAPAPDVPPNDFEGGDFVDGNFAAGRSLYIPPPEDGSAVALAIDPASERLQKLEPWPAWDGEDFTDMPIIIQTRGKTTTDQISPAGAWLRYRGHLERFSDNLLMGAENAHTGERGRARNAITREAGRPIAEIARDYRARGLRWVIAGDANYGEGSSREHAALSPRLLGCASVIARSFARIHESNLKKQGLLALTFAHPADYDRLRESDRLSLVDLAAMAPGRPVPCRVRHADGTHIDIELIHSYSTAQLRWFQCGSALNALRAVSRQPLAVSE